MFDICHLHAVESSMKIIITIIAFHDQIETLISPQSFYCDVEICTMRSLCSWIFCHFSQNLIHIIVDILLLSEPISIEAWGWFLWHQATSNDFGHPADCMLFPNHSMLLYGVRWSLTIKKTTHKRLPNITLQIHGNLSFEKCLFKNCTN